MNGQKVEYSIDKLGHFVIKNYNWAKPFSSFFPGIGGKWGVSLWGYYVNRAQGISSLGIRDKDRAIMEFFSFNKACQLVGRQGFRTFLKLDEKTFYEPFVQSANPNIFQKMIVSSHGLEIVEVNKELQLKTRVEYFPLVNLPIAGLVREVSIENRSGQDINFEIVDGLPLILPFGMDQNCIKFISRHIEAMMQVEMVGKIPYYKLKQIPKDKPEVSLVKGGNFYFSYLPSSAKKAIYIVDPKTIFGYSESFTHPFEFASKGLKDIQEKDQMYENITPSAFTAFATQVQSNQKLEFYSFVGNSHSQSRLIEFSQIIKKEGEIDRQRLDNRETIHQIKENQFTASNDIRFDGYCKQTYLDNVMRGGMPVVFKGREKKSVFYLYSRKHGDLERDYNHFILEDTYLSQGNSHFRDVNQNRRLDVWFEPEVEDLGILTFFNLLQLDGYNPLVVNGITYTASDVKGLKKWLRNLVSEAKLADELLQMTKRKFTPGEFIMKLDGDTKHSRYDSIVGELLSFCSENGLGQPSEGFWVDHWTYNLDLIDNYLCIYPDKKNQLLFQRDEYTFFDNKDSVLPRCEKYVLVDGKVRQYEAVIRDKNKVKMLDGRSFDPYKVRCDFGKGKIYKTNLLVKMLCLIANKVACLDPEGIGMEMEADKPGWNDPLNGLPGLLASAVGETFELKRCCLFLLDCLSATHSKTQVVVFEELFELVSELNKLIRARINTSKDMDAFTFWDKSHILKEEYRDRTLLGISGKEKSMQAVMVKEFLGNIIMLVDLIFTTIPKRKLFDKMGIVHTYFLNEVVEYEFIYSDVKKGEQKLSRSGKPLVRPTKFRQKPVSIFLEGSVHLLKIKKELAKAIYDSIKQSKIYDKKLKMYKTSAPIGGESFEIGRARVYLPGWIENESVYLHMEYKYLLEILKAGLYKEFYDEANNLLIPYLKPQVYGRSILENSSFIVSSAFPNPKMHGRGFQARLTGASAEFINMWTIIVAGEKPFLWDKELKLKLSPILPHYYFTTKTQVYSFAYEKNPKPKLIVSPNSFAFKFLGTTLVIYHNKKRKNTFGEDAARVVKYKLKYFGGKIVKIVSDTIPMPFSLDVRDKKVEFIDVVLD